MVDVIYEKTYVLDDLEHGGLGVRYEAISLTDMMELLLDLKNRVILLESQNTKKE